MAVIIGKKGRDISQAQAMEYVAGYTVALDMTARDLQDEAKSKGLPWTEAKGTLFLRLNLGCIWARSKLISFYCGQNFRI